MLYDGERILNRRGRGGRRERNAVAEVANPVAVAVGERTHQDFVAHGATWPLRGGGAAVLKSAAHSAPFTRPGRRTTCEVTYRAASS